MPVQETIQQTMSLDPTVVRIVTASVGFIFLSLVGIIVWLARGLMTKVDTIVSKQDTSAIEIAEIKKDMDFANKYISGLKENIKEHSDKLEKQADEINLIKMELLKRK